MDRVIRFGLRCALIAVVAAEAWFLPTSQCAAADINPALQASSEANIALRHVLEARHHLVAAATTSGATTSGTATVPATTNRGLPTGLTYTADFSISQPYGNVGSKTNWLPGGFDGVLGYGLNPTFRASLSYYELQHYPVGFNSGTVPLFLQGFAPPIGTVNLANAGINVTTKDRFFFVTISKLFQIGPVPLVVSPIYLARWSKVGNGPSDQQAFMFNGFPVTGLHTRTAQYNALAVTLPLLSTPRMFGTLTLAPAWLTHLNGLNQQNHAQIYEVLYVEYAIDDKTKIFAQPQVSKDYLPPDPYAEHVAGYFFGANRKITKDTFVQVSINTGSPTNYAPYGVDSLTCQALPCSQNPVVPHVGALKATQLQIQFGVGSPSILPF